MISPSDTAQTSFSTADVTNACENDERIETTMLVHTRRFLPAFGIAGDEDQRPVALYTILSVNRTVGDCAAYEGIGPADADTFMIERIKAGGTKISEADARHMFDAIENLNLRYRR